MKNNPQNVQDEKCLKLSEKIDNKNPYKNKLIEMESDKNDNPLYSILVLGFFIYCFVFVVVLTFSKTYNYEISLIGFFFVTICLFHTYKKEKLILKGLAYPIIFIIAIPIAIFAEISDKSGIENINIIKTFLFFCEINQKSYLALLVLSFLTLGISFCHINSPWKIYNQFYLFQRNYKPKWTVNNVIDANYDYAIIFFFAFLYAIYSSISTPQDSFSFNLKLLAPLFILEYPFFVYRAFKAKRYIDTFNKASHYHLKKGK